MTPDILRTQAAAVLHFWFKDLTPDDWFEARPALDVAIRARFGALRRALKETPPDPDSLDSDSLLAAVITLDQFSRNMFRGSAEAFAADGLALALAEYAVAHGLDAGQAPERRLFLYMPFMHAEDPAIQTRCVELFEGLGLADHLVYAREHRDVIGRFGRFPARNAALGRVSTDAERKFLDAGKG